MSAGPSPIWFNCRITELWRWPPFSFSGDALIDILADGPSVGRGIASELEHWFPVVWSAVLTLAESGAENCSSCHGVVIGHVITCSKPLVAIGRINERPFVFLVDGNAASCTRLTAALRADGLRVVSVTRIAERGPWRIGDVLIAAFANSLRWWNTVGASAVIVVAETDEERILAERSGAAAILMSQGAAALVSSRRSFPDVEL